MNIARAVAFKGMITLVPIAITLYLAYWLLLAVEGGAAQLIPEDWYFFGAGWLLVLLAIGITGVLMHLFLFEKLFNYAASLLDRIPLLKSVHSALRDLLDYLTKGNSGELSAVVSLRLNDHSALIGFVTREQAVNWSSWLPEGEVTAVYFPMSYQLGGYTLLVANEQLERLDVSVEQAMRFVLTAGVQRASGREE